MNNPLENFKDEFLAEASENLVKAETDLILLEKNPEAPNPDLIANIFRSIHSIKGASGFMGYENIGKLTHAMETLLQMMRDKEIQAETGYIDALLAGADRMKNLLENLDASNDIDISGILNRISGLIGSAGAPETRKKLDTPVRFSDTCGNDIGFEINEFHRDHFLANYRHLYLLKYNLWKIDNEEGLKPLTLIRKLNENGAIIETKLETGAVDFDTNLSELPLMFHILYATDLTADRITGRDTLGNGGITEIGRGAEKRSGKCEQISDIETECTPASMTGEPTVGVQDAAESAAKKELADHADTIRLRVGILDKLMKLAGELVLVRNHLLAMTESDYHYRGISQRLNLVTTELQETIMQTRLQSIGNLFAKLPRIVRDLSHKLGKDIEIETVGNEVELDKTILESLTDPMIHLIRNCCDHGIEPPEVRKKAGKPVVGKISVRAWHEAGQINIEVSDDGKGLDPEMIRSRAVDSGLKTAEELSRMNDKEVLSLILLSGFSTAEQVSDISGRGVGLDVVRAGAERLGGVIELSSEKTKGTRIHLRLPLTLAIIPCLLIEVEGHRYAIPQVNLVELVCLRNEEVYTRIECAGDQEVYRLRDRLLPVARLGEVLKRPKPFSPDVKAEICGIYAQRAQDVLSGKHASDAKALNFAVVKIGAKRYGLVVDRVIGVEEIVVNPIHSALKTLKIYSGTTIMGDGTVALILDIEGIARHADIQFNLKEEETAKVLAKDETQTILLFRSGIQEQFAVPLPMIRRVEHIRTSHIERVGDKEFIAADGTPHRVIRLETVLQVSPCVGKENMLLLLPKHIRRPFGILISEVTDTVTTTLRLNTDSHMEEGLLGTAIIREHMTLYLDIFKLIERAEPDWFSERKKNAPPPEERRHILLLEDTAFFRNLVRGYLETDGYTVTTAENGQAGIAAVKGQAFDLIVSDLDMPIMNGWSFMEYIRRESAVPNIPAIALTALDSEADRLRAKNAGFDAYQIKLDREELLTNVSNFLHLRT